MTPTHENTNTSTDGGGHPATDERKNEEGVSPTTDGGTKRPLDASATPDIDTRAKKARRTTDGPIGSSDGASVEPFNIGSTSDIAFSGAVSTAPELPSDSVPSPERLDVMESEDLAETAGKSKQSSGDGDGDGTENMAINSMASAFLNLPFDVFAEILILTEYPGDILAVARTSKQLCTLLVEPTADFIWKKARTVLGLPDPLVYSAKIKNARKSDGSPESLVGVGCFAGREPAYAAFVFDGGICEVG